MVEPWEFWICNTRECLAELTVPKNMMRNGRIKKDALDKFKIYPKNKDNKSITFVCNRCGRKEIWGPERIKLAQILYKG